MVPADCQQLRSSSRCITFKHAHLHSSPHCVQAIAREDKGILGKDWNKSDKTFYRTTSYNPTVAPEQGRAGAELSYRGDPAPALHSTKVCIHQPGLAPMLIADPVQSLSSGSLGVFSMAGIIIGSLLGVLILVGGGWNLLKLRRQVRCLLFIQPQ